MSPKKHLFLPALTVLALAIHAVPAAAAGERGTTSLDLLDDGELLDNLVALDAEDIVKMRKEMSDARAEIKGAMDDIDDARAELAGVPGGDLVLSVALNAARGAAESVVSDVMTKVRTEISVAESELEKTDYSAQEKEETRTAIAALREEMTALELTLAEFVAALKS